MKTFLDIEPLLDLAILAQVYNDRKTGTVGLGEAGWLEWHTEETWDEFLSAGDQLEIIAICELVNSLHERAGTILKEAAEHRPPSESECEAMGGEPDNGPELTAPDSAV